MNNDYIHLGRRSWWDGSVKTLCGLKFAANKNEEQGWLTSATCPMCTAIKKAKR